MQDMKPVLEAQIRLNISHAVEIAIKNAPINEQNKDRDAITRIVSDLLGLNHLRENKQSVTKKIKGLI